MHETPVTTIYKNCKTSEIVKRVRRDPTLLTEAGIRVLDNVFYRVLQSATELFRCLKTQKSRISYRRLSLLPYPAHHFCRMICPPSKRCHRTGKGDHCQAPNPSFFPPGNASSASSGGIAAGQLLGRDPAVVAVKSHSRTRLENMRRTHCSG